MQEMPGRKNIRLDEVNRFREKLARAENVLLFTHRNPDIDAIGSTMALARYLFQSSKKHKILLTAPLPEKFFYLREWSEIIGLSDVDNDVFDLAVGLDCSTLDWSGAEDKLKEFQAKGIGLVNIDHHPNSSYGEINIIDKESPSTSLILYEIFDFWGTPVDPKMATEILAGIIGDTNGFSNAATNTEAYLAASELLRAGAKYNQIMKQFQQNDHNDWLRLWSKVLSRLIKNDKLNLVYSVMLNDDLRGEESNVLDGVTNFLNNLTGVRLVMTLKESQNGEIKVSLRSLDGQINVAKIANWFAGGGHRLAAGFSIKGSLEWEGKYWQVV
ncbi:hypothetical protein A3H03_01375 [Candidatus Kuenenbacteria bacterium RIFCSPLOWO2_12_FULL_42_13]|uniref:Phosphoesterase RecJ domain-containing protein n=3 Tax=Candidatus Kueneniibacteriota TaxID=1752740 RepID=A0A0G1BUP9_9BACT|nr:MAG: Phosphoesterase RecJ domain-containing protein [Candidatus Kuenenbacteria bacterium GW2011_GWA2_42_15]OGG91542.1 MAG: hypothetical protein A3H03_01375 [Candidatus Kuenenbacteria bacterium RIFCSPLOWO2_12_FULL_42_13]OGG95850.1 MAG: hypothetical protein A2V95_02090 [Candidatus Kuenenbacteria bacterium RBG_16_41_7]